MRITPKQPFESAGDYAYRVLRQNIIQMLLTPGAAICPAELADELGVSRTPIQKACAHLAAEGLLTIVPQKGSYVSIIDLQRVYESVYMRNLLDQAAIRCLCGSPRLKEALLSLQANLHQQEFSLTNHMIQDVMALDNSFHSIIYTYCGMDHIHSAIASISADQDRVRHIKLHSQIRLHETVEEHGGLVQALQAGDADWASRLSCEHVSKFGVDIVSVCQEHPSFFSSEDSNLAAQFNCKKETFYTMQKNV